MTTYQEHRLQGWKEHEVWAPYWEAIKDFHGVSQPTRELFEICVSTKGLSRSTHQLRKEITAWAARYIPGHQLIWEHEILPTLNELIAPRGLQILSYQWGKDGRGSLPDHYFYILFKNGYIPIVNHHDVLGHLLGYLVPGVLDLSKKLVDVAERGHWLLREVADRSRQEGVSPQRIRSRENYIRRSIGLTTMAWNWINEKLYYTDVNELTGEHCFSLVGAFSTVYNNTLSDRAPIEQMQHTTAALGFLSPHPASCLLMPPQEIRSHLLRRPHEGDSARVESLRREARRAIGAYDDFIRSMELSVELDSAGVGHLHGEFAKLVKDTLFAETSAASFGFRRQQKKRLPISRRWELYKKAIFNHPDFSKIIDTQTMISIATHQTEIAARCFDVEAAIMEERLGVK